MSPFRRTTALVVLLAYLAISTVGAGWVLCVGANGHSAIESLTAGCCATVDGTTAESASAENWGSAAEDHAAEHAACGAGDPCDAPADTPTDTAFGADQLHSGRRGADDCGDCDDVPLSDLAQSRRIANDDLPMLSPALPASSLAMRAASAWAAISPRAPVVRPRLAPRPPPRHAEIACTILRL